MNNKVMYMTFYENWVEVMEMCTPEEWYELCKIITNLRFKGIDTDAKTISNMKIKMAWNLIRPSILKSNRDKRYNDTKRNGGNAEETKKSVITEVKTTEFDIPNCQIPNTADLSPSNNEDIPTPQQVVEKPTEAIKTTIEDTKINITEKEINEVMGTYKGTIEELNKRTTINDFSSIDRLVPKLNKEMALKQIKPYHSREKNIGRLNDALSTFLKDVSSDDRAKYYEFILEKSFAVA